MSFALLLPLAALAPRFRVTVGRNHGFHTGRGVHRRRRARAAAGARRRTRRRRSISRCGLATISAPWYIQVFNLSNYMLSALAAWVVAAAVGPATTLSFALAGLLAAAVFVGVNHMLLAMMLRLGARPYVPRERALLRRPGWGSSS